MPIPKLTDSVQYLKGIGPARAAVFAELGLRTIGDLLFYFPRDLSHLPGRMTIAEALKQRDGVATVGGVMNHCRFTGRRHRPIFSCRLTDPTATMDLTWFNGGWLRGQFGEGDNVVVFGKLTPGRYGPQLTNPKITRAESDAGDRLETGQWEPVYPATAAISSRQIQQVVRRNLPGLLRLVEEFFPPQYLRRRSLLDRWLAVGRMHFPALSAHAVAGEGDAAGEPTLTLEPGLANDVVQARYAEARHRLAWDEAFLFQLALAVRRRTRQSTGRADPLPCSDAIRQRILARFPFPLTGAQAHAIEQICGDIAQPVPMSRLLQGDVGSGKTVVALFAALVAVAAGKQAAIMAPTEILASQHYDRITQYLKGSRVRWALLTGSLPAAERKRIHAQLAAGELDLVVGTSALLSEGVRFARLALAVIDEQHKFGVRQRATLRDAEGAGGSAGSGPQPHLLVMTATPIPRSLALTVFGDLAVSTLDELPPGRGPTQTRIVAPANQEAALDFIEARLEQGGQAFFVCPRVGSAEDEESPDAPDAERDEIISAEAAYRALQPRFEKYGVALVHGQMDRDRQRDVLAAFAAGRVRVLVATTVVEVGVDVARANVMAVLSAERFGLAQLHQLRGRIGRSADIAKSYCLLFVTDDAAADRVAIMEKTGDGFRIAEQDLARRGPGQFFGVAQHGLPEFKHIDLARDLPLLREARKDAFAIVAADPALAQPGHSPLRRHMMAAHGRSLGLIDAG